MKKIILAMAIVASTVFIACGGDSDMPEVPDNTNPTTGTTLTPSTIINIPDPNFKNYLLNNFDTNKDNEIQFSEVNTFEGKIDVRKLSIKSLTGIEAFINLKEIFCGDNLLDRIDVSANKELTRLFCENNNIKVINISENKKLTGLKCINNPLTSLNVANGNNKNMTVYTQKAKLTWIKADSYLTSIPGHWKVDAGVTINTGGTAGTGGTPVLVTSIKLNITSLTMMNNATTKLTPNLIPANATNKSVTWSSSNKNIATVDNQGNVTSKNKGKATITVTSVDGSKKATCSIEVITTVKIGAEFQGGKVAYIYKSGDPGYIAGETHGFILSPYNQARVRPFATTGSLTGSVPTSDELGAGKANTEAIVRNLKNGQYAAKTCADFEVNGYDDWYLPSKNELDKVYENINVLKAGTSVFNYYWSSSVRGVNGEYAWMQNFNNGHQSGSSIQYQHAVRAIRYF